MTDYELMQLDAEWWIVDELVGTVFHDNGKVGLLWVDWGWREAIQSGLPVDNADILSWFSLFIAEAIKEE